MGQQIIDQNFPVTNAFMVNARYINGPLLRDLNVNYILFVLQVVAIDQNDNRVDCFLIVYRTPYASKATQYLFKKEGATLDGLLTWWTANNTHNLKKYTDLLCIDITHFQNPVRDILLNNAFITERQINGEGNTDLYLDQGLKNLDKKIFTVQGDQTDTNGGENYPGPGSYVLTLTGEDNTATLDDTFPAGSSVEYAGTIQVGEGDVVDLPANFWTGTTYNDPDSGIAFSYADPLINITRNGNNDDVTITVVATLNGFDYSASVTLTA